MALYEGAVFCWSNMELLGYILIFISGLFVGSFLNVAADRIPKGVQILTGRSKCDYCGVELKPKDLIPLLSFVIHRGRCSYCKKELSFYYPISEILTGLMFVLVAAYTNVFHGEDFWVWIGFLYLIVIACFYIVIFLSDIKYKIIPNKFVYAGIIFVLLFIIATTSFSAYQSYFYLKNDPFGKFLLEAGYWSLQMARVLKGFGVTIFFSFLIGLFFWFLIFLTKGKGMGGGDVKLGFFIGLVNGFPKNIVGIFLGFLFGAAFSLVLVCLKKKGMKDTIPFGPFLLLGSVVAFVFGQAILNWYIGFL